MHISKEEITGHPFIQYYTGFSLSVLKVGCVRNILARMLPNFNSQSPSCQDILEMEHQLFLGPPSQIRAISRFYCHKQGQGMEAGGKGGDGYL